MKKKNDDRDLVDAWEKGKPVDVARTRLPSSVLSIRLPSSVFEEVSLKAEAAGSSASQFAREVIERGLASEGPSTPLDVASMFHRWAAELTQGIRISPRVSSGLARTTWVSFYIPSGPLAPQDNRQSTDRMGEVTQPMTYPARRELIA